MLERPRILIVEDSLTQAKKASLFLEAAGFDVESVSTGKKGVEYAQKGGYDLAVVDIILPDMDGFKVCELIKKNAASYFPVLILSKRSQVPDKVKGLDVGADDYLAKPYDPRELLARIKVLLRIKEQQAELARRLKEEKMAYEKLKGMALKDQLTGLYNRYYLFDELERRFSASKRYKRPLACIMLDVDHFRSFNNRYGHQTGDWVLKSIAELMIKSLRTVDLVCRYGGEEFTVILPEADTASALGAAERIRKKVEGTVWQSPRGDLSVTVSCGVASYPEKAVTDGTGLLKEADDALLLAKKKGRNRVEPSPPKRGDLKDGI